MELFWRTTGLEDFKTVTAMIQQPSNHFSDDDLLLQCLLKLAWAGSQQSFIVLSGARSFPPQSSCLSLPLWPEAGESTGKHDNIMQAP